MLASALVIMSQQYTDKLLEEKLALNYICTTHASIIWMFSAKVIYI